MSTITTAVAPRVQAVHRRLRGSRPSTGETFERENPATGEPIGALPVRRRRKTPTAPIAAALQAYRSRSWRDLTGARKQQLLAWVADWLRDHMDELTTLVSAEAGKPVAWARFDVLFAADFFDYFSGFVRDVGGRTIPGLRPDLFAYTLKEPAGVAGDHHPVELPAADCRAEGGAGACSRLPGRPQAGTANAAHRARARPCIRRARVPGRRVQRRHGLGARKPGGRATLLAPGRGGRLVHRLDGNRRSASWRPVRRR